ncbi:MAG: helix-turn-helix transcriptional regulator [Actinomycetota bacterium]|nr:helix-turn-helix transcriptional regulator [Actinomycetota bacterium]
MAIRTIRKERGLTQEELSLRAGLHETYISHIESGHRNPTWGKVLEISAALDVQLTQLAQLADELERKI